MKLIQKVGPFSEGEIIFAEKGVNYLQLGVEYPQSIPIPWLTNDQIEKQLGDLTFENSWPYTLFIGAEDEEEDKDHENKQKDIVITDRDILEFNFNRQSVRLVAHELDNPYFIINISYEIAD